MIYDQVDPSEPIRQGDIFRNVPRVDFSASRLTVLDEKDCRQTTWIDSVEDGSATEGVAAILPINAVMAIVISQNCDTARGEYVSLCQIDLFSKVVSTPPTTPKKWADLIVKHSREHLRYFYLPPNPSLGIVDRMAADLRILLRVPRIDLEFLRTNRIGRLNYLGSEHFRENIAQFFRRYPYDEWYPLNRDEFEEYQKRSTETIPRFPWQE